MRKVIFIFFVVILVGVSFIKVNSRDKDDFEVDYEIVPIRNLDKFSGISCIVTINNNISFDLVNISLDVFGGINEYTQIAPGEIIVDLKVINKSLYNYRFRSDSLKFVIKDTNNGHNYNIYRSKNKALAAIIDDLDLGDSNIDLILKGMGYLGIEDLYKYYLDFYNDLYGTSYSKLEEFNIEELFSGEISNYYESNDNIRDLAINYFYQSVINIKYKGKLFNTFDISSINLFNSTFNHNLSDTFSVIVTDKYTDIYKDYGFVGSLEFDLERY